MKVIGISGSPRKGGNTETLVKYALDPFRKAGWEGAICRPGELNGLSARADKCGDILNQEKRLQQAKVLGGNILKYASMMKREKYEYKNS